MKLFSRKYSTGLVLSGGGVRGIAHLGVLKALVEKKIEIKIISGASAGALMGAFFSAGLAPEEILEIISHKKFYDLVRISFPRSGFFNVDGLRKVIKSHLKIERIEDLPIPMFITVTNFREGKSEYINKGSLVDYLIASAGIPMLFEVTKINNIPYIDGGVMDNLPIRPLREKCKKIIAVHTNPVVQNEEVRNPARVAERAFHLAIAADVNRKKKLADIFIEPPELQNFGLFDFKKSKEIFQIGYDTAMLLL